MAKIDRFEELEAWQKGRHLSRKIYFITKGEEFYNDFGLRDQIRRASISVMANIAEGFERNGNKEFLHFLSIAKASAGEVRSLLYIALDQDYIEQTSFEKAKSETESTLRLIAGLMRYLRSSTMKGAKYKD